MLHNDPLRTIDIIAIEREASRLRAEAAAQMFRSTFTWLRAKLSFGPTKAASHTA